jgi:hypothetical protein
MSAASPNQFGATCNGCEVCRQAKHSIAEGRLRDQYCPAIAGGAADDARERPLIPTKRGEFILNAIMAAAGQRLSDSIDDVGRFRRVNNTMAPCITIDYDFAVPAPGSIALSAPARVAAVSVAK